DLVGIIGEHVELKRSGSDYRGPCPFHGGTHRNFAVIPKKGMFYCFVCHEAGDVFTFFMKRLGMDYPTAVREVARRVGITIPERGPSGPDPQEPLYNAVAVAAEWFARQLRESPEGDVARQYLGSRGLDLETVPPLGTGLTSDQAQLVRRHTSHVILLYDSDEAGLRATFRAADELLRERLRVSVATLPPGEDPDTLVQRRGAAGLDAILKDAVD